MPFYILISKIFCLRSDMVVHIVSFLFTSQPLNFRLRFSRHIIVFITLCGSSRVAKRFVFQKVRVDHGIIIVCWWEMKLASAAPVKYLFLGILSFVFFFLFYEHKWDSVRTLSPPRPHRAFVGTIVIDSRRNVRTIIQEKWGPGRSLCTLCICISIHMHTHMYRYVHISLYLYIYIYLSCLCDICLHARIYAFHPSTSHTLSPVPAGSLGRFGAGGPHFHVILVLFWLK